MRNQGQCFSVGVIYGYVGKISLKIKYVLRLYRPGEIEINSLGNHKPT